MKLYNVFDEINFLTNVSKSESGKDPIF